MRRSALQLASGQFRRGWIRKRLQDLLRARICNSLVTAHCGSGQPPSRPLLEARIRLVCEARAWADMLVEVALMSTPASFTRGSGPSDATLQLMLQGP